MSNENRSISFCNQPQNRLVILEQKNWRINDNGFFLILLNKILN